MEISKSNIKIDFKKSQGSWLYDKNTNKKFLDFMSMYSSLTIGYNHQVFHTQEFKDEVLNISHSKICNCEIFSDEKENFIKEFSEFVNQDIRFKYDFFHFACTGALAVEHGLKAAIDYTGKKKIISFKDSFHGIMAYGNFVTDRTGSVKNRLDGFVEEDSFLKVNNIKELEKILEDNSENIAAAIIEPIKCSNGDLYYPKDFFDNVFNLLKKHNVISVVDEIQTGFGITGDIWYTKDKADIIIFGKKSQVSGFITTKEIGEKLNPNRFCVTWDGDLIDMVRSKYIIQTINKDNLISEKMNSISRFLFDNICKIKGIYNIRGKGYLLAFDLENEKKRDEFHKNALSNCFLTIATGEKTIRLRPNLNISFDDAKKAVEIIKKSMINK